MKRIVTIIVRGDVPDSVHFAMAIADILEQHAKDIRSKDSVAGRSAHGRLTGSTRDMPRVSADDATVRPPVPWEIAWSADYDSEHGQEPGK